MLKSGMQNRKRCIKIGGFLWAIPKGDMLIFDKAYNNIIHVVKLFT